VRTKGRLARLGAALVGTAAGLVLAYVLVVYVGAALLSGLAAALALLPRAFVWLVLALQDGADGWAIAGRIASSLAGAISTTRVVFSLIALELIGAAALYVLQRLLRDEVREVAEGAEDAETIHRRDRRGAENAEKNL
jgi:hypothetical protein